MLVWLKGRLQGAAMLMARSLNRFLDWLFESRNPAVVFVRECVRRNRVLISAARAFIRAVRALPTLHQKILEKFRPLSVRRLQSIMAARAIGGSVAVSELERIWELAKRGTRVLVVAEGPELDQIAIVLDAIRVRATFCSSLAACEAANFDADDFDLIVVAPIPGLAQYVAELGSKVGRPDRLIRVGETARRSDYFAAGPLAAAIEGPDSARRPIHQRIASGEPLRVVFLSDVGFQYGAGVALKRQVASLLLKGWEVSMIAWLPGDLLDPPKVTGVSHFGGWRGVHNVFEVHASKGLGSDEIISELMKRITALDPDVVITGNMHGAGWPLTLLTTLRAGGIKVVAFMHDTYFVTGRCAQPMACELYRTGCNSSCPTPNEYPRLAPEKIAAAWRERGEIFSGANRVPLISNSQWTQSIAFGRFGNAATTDVIHLALDHELFAPMSKATVRRLLGIREGKSIVALGAVDVHNQWKGGPLFHGLHKALLNRSDLTLVLFGRSSETLKSDKSFGLVMDERMMPFILNAADIFVSTATAESFGQSLLEASACGVPVVAFDVGGVGDVVVHNETGILVQEPSVENLLKAIDRLIANPSEREALGRAGRARVMNKFTLSHQADAWVDGLKRIC